MNKTLSYQILNTCNPDYNEIETKKLQLLYKGGASIEKNAELFIPREPMESNESVYYNRLKCISYRNYFAKIVNDYVSDLFSKSFSINPASDASDKNTPGTEIQKEADSFWREFGENTDLQNHNLSNVLSCVLTSALTTGKAYIGVDFPKTNVIPQSRAEEDELGLARAYTIHIPTLSVIDWEKDDHGNFTYVVIKNETTPRKSFTDSRDKKITQFKIWEKDPESQIVKFSVYEIITKIDKEPKKEDKCNLVDEGIVSFKQIPVLQLHIPTQLWIGNLIGGLCQEHLRRSSSLVHAENKNLFSIPFYQQGPDLPANGDLNTINQNTNRGTSTALQMRSKGFAVGSIDDKLSFVEPSGASYQIIDQQLKDLVDAIHSVCNQMSSTVGSHTAVAAGRSGLSKALDNHSKELVLTAYAQLIKEFSVNLYTLVSEGRNETIKWSVQGFSDFKIIDREALIQECIQIELIRKIAPSRTWYKKNSMRLITELDNNLSVQEQTTILKEITDYFDKLPDDELITKEPDNSFNKKDQHITEDKKAVNKKD